MIFITIMGIITGLLSVSLFPMLDRAEFVNTADLFKNTLRKAHWLAMTENISHRLKNANFDMVFKEKVPPNIQISSTRCHSFSAFGFAAGGTITLETETYSTKVMVSPVGLIRQTEIEIKLNFI